jgi:hypothetical protein
MVEPVSNAGRRHFLYFYKATDLVAGEIAISLLLALQKERSQGELKINTDFLLSACG